MKTTEELLQLEEGRKFKSPFVAQVFPDVEHGTEFLFVCGNLTVTFIPGQSEGQREKNGKTSQTNMTVQLSEE